MTLLHPPPNAVVDWLRDLWLQLKALIYQTPTPEDPFRSTTA